MGEFGSPHHLICFIPLTHLHISHCADAVLSFANKATVVSEVSATLLNFVAYWVQTQSDYDTLISKTMDKDWAENHKPVLSRRHHDPKRYTTFFTGNQPVPIEPPPVQDDHILYTKFSLGNPMGRYIDCPTGRCKQKLGNKQTKLGVRISCPVCLLRCTIPSFKTDRSDILCGKALVAVHFPIKRYPITKWDTPEDAKPLLNDYVLDPSSPKSTPAPSPPPSPIPSHSKSITALLSAPAMVVRSTSLPSTGTASQSSSSSNRHTQIPRLASTPSLRLVATPSPPTPQEPQRRKKRSEAEIRSQLWQPKRQKRDKGD